VYTSTPTFLLLLASMALGHTININGYIDYLDKMNDFGVNDIAFMVIIFLLFVLMLIGALKLFKALHYILKENFRYHPYVVWGFT
ncbi:hypothetical protein M8831_33660, partial [Pseudomonas aeruginosa]